MNETQTINYLVSLNFGLKDFGATETKYSEYKTDKFKAILSEYKTDISVYLFGLVDTIKNELALNPYCMDCLRLDRKSNIRQLKTLINGTTLNLNLAFINGLDDLNNNENRIFNILFYLTYYNNINQSMKEVLNQLVDEYPKKATVKKLTV